MSVEQNINIWMDRDFRECQTYPRITIGLQDVGTQNELTQFYLSTN